MVLPTCFLASSVREKIFGEIGFLRDTPRSATVATLEQTRCLVLPQQDFLTTLEASPALCIALLRVLAGRLAEADRLLARYAPDPLTGLTGRRAFHDLYHKLSAGARRRGNGAILLLIDIDNLRGVNDAFGYAVGDDVLKATAEALMQSSRTTDLVARYGSDEFCCTADGRGRCSLRSDHQKGERTSGEAGPTGRNFPSASATMSVSP